MATFFATYDFLLVSMVLAAWQPGLVHGQTGAAEKLLTGTAAFGDWRTDAPGVVRTLFYRKEFFGRPFSELTQQVMRGPSPWSVGERETFAAFVSRLNQCVF